MQRHYAFRWLSVSPAVRDGARIAGLVLIWYTAGTLLSFYNKLLVGKNSTVFTEPFPAPLFMSGVQFAMQHMIARSVFQAGIVQRKADPLSWQDWSRMVLPNGACTGLDIGFSNMSLVFISLSFYTMCKATVPLFLLAFAFIWGIERPTWRLGLVVLVITIGLVLLVSGETQFDPAGFALVMVAACCAGLRFTLTQVFLHGHHDSAAAGGPLEILEALTPVMSVTVFTLSLVWERLWVVLPRSTFFASSDRMLLTMAIIFVGAVLAFLLVWAEYQLIKETSALTFMIAGTCKEIVTVLAAVFFMGDPFSLINGMGLGVVIAGVALFNAYKLQKLKSKDPVDMEMQQAAAGATDGDHESKPLLGPGHGHANGLEGKTTGLGALNGSAQDNGESLGANGTRGTSDSGSGVSPHGVHRTFVRPGSPGGERERDPLLSLVAAQRLAPRQHHASSPP